MGDTLPPGFRFHPTDEELITYYLARKVSDSGFITRAIRDVDFNKCEPWELPGRFITRIICSCVFSAIEGRCFCEPQLCGAYYSLLICLHQIEIKWKVCKSFSQYDQEFMKTLSCFSWMLFQFTVSGTWNYNQYSIFSFEVVQVAYPEVLFLLTKRW